MLSLDNKTSILRMSFRVFVVTWKVSLLNMLLQEA